jgi:carbon storage regulator CsrA
MIVKQEPKTRGNLLVTRKRGESIILTGCFGRIEIKHVGYRWGQTRLMINAPLDVTVHRNEIQELVDAENSK